MSRHFDHVDPDRKFGPTQPGLLTAKFRISPKFRIRFRGPSSYGLIDFLVACFGKGTEHCKTLDPDQVTGAPYQYSGLKVGGSEDRRDRQVRIRIWEEQILVNSTTRHADRIQVAIASNGAAKSALIASWQRSSSLHGLDPATRNPPERLTDFELRNARQEVEPLVQAAQSSLDRLYLAVGGVGCCVLLANRNGVPVERRGTPGDDATFYSWGLWPGAIWSEESEGTNGIGTCLIEQRAMTIHRDQHFYTRNTLLSCTTAPVFDHEGHLIAALDVSSCRADVTERFVNLIAVAVSDAAARIEAECFRLAYPQARILVVPVADKGARALIAVDADDLVVGATRAARQALGITEACLRKSLPAADLLSAAGKVIENLATAERGVLQRALARADGNVTAAAGALGMSRATFYRKLHRLDLHRAH